MIIIDNCTRQQSAKNEINFYPFRNFISLFFFVVECRQLQLKEEEKEKNNFV